MIDLPFIVEPGYEMVWTKPLARPFPGAEPPGGDCTSPFVVFSLHIENVRVPEDRTAPCWGPPRQTVIGVGTGNHAGTPTHHVPSRTAPSCPSPHIHSNRMQGSWGATPGQRRTSLFVLSSLRTEIMRAPEDRAGPCRGACCPPIPPLNAIGAGMDNHAGMTVHYFSSRDAPPDRSLMSRAIVCRGPGVQPPGRGELRCSFYRLFAPRS